jgi:putative ABC transport system permease protein
VIPGVVAAGTLTRLDADVVTIGPPAGVTVDDVDPVGASPGLFDVAAATVRAGRLFDDGHLERADTVAVLGAGAASALGISALDGEPTVLVGDVRLTVIGLLEPVDELDLLDGAVLLPETTAAEGLGATVPTEVRIRVAVGEAERVAREALVALDSGADDVIVSVPRERRDIRDAVAEDIDRLGLWLGVALAVLGTLVVIATHGAGLRTRHRELGLRRAFGARRGALVGQAGFEGAVVGVLGALVGTAVGLVAVLGLASLAGWGAAIELVWVLITALGAVVLTVSIATIGAAVSVRGEPGRLLDP